MIKNKKIKTSSVLGFLLFLINPFITLIYSSFYFIKNKNCITPLALSISLIFIYQPLMYDTSTNFFTTQYGELNNLYNIIPFKLKQTFNIDYFYSILFYTAIIFYCWLTVISSFAKKDNTSLNINILFLVAFFSIIYRDIMDLNRFYLSISISFYYILYIRNEKKQTSMLLMFFFCLLSFFIHSFSAIIYLTFFLRKIIKKNQLYLYYFLICLFIGVFANNIIQDIISNINIAGFSLPKAYFSDGGWGRNEYSSLTLMRKLLECTIILNLFILAFFYKKKNKYNDSVLNLLMLLCGLCLLFFSYKTFFERTFIILCLFSIYYFSLPSKNSWLKYSLILLIILRFFIINSIRYGDIFFYGHTDVIPNTSEKIDLQLKPFYYPTLFLLDIDNGYSDEFINKNSIWK
ncbi:EpsG family protein [Providencia rettgeri]|uniref:EpsG family protein n=1 Tax=Providencia rettgeri TaxID=587 RepID=UPI003018E257